MLIKITCFLFTSFVFACSDCFSKCSNNDLNFCLSSCNCPLFGPKQVNGGSFKGQSGLIFVPNLNKAESLWVSSHLSCDLTCSQSCSSKYLDYELETCVKSCGCEALLSPNPVQDNFKEKCDGLCKGSPAGCAIDCYDHFIEKQDTWYFWLIVPVMFLIFLAAWLTIRSKKEDDYILM